MRKMNFKTQMICEREEDSTLPFSIYSGLPSQFFDDPEEAKETMGFTKSVVQLVEKKMKEKRHGRV
jgi:hypothetical protein